MTVTVDSTPPPRSGSDPDLGSAASLSCRECGATSPLGPFYACTECFGPLEVAYDYGRVTREQIQAGPASIWRYRDLLPVPAGVAEIPNTDPGFTRLVRADNLARELGITVNAVYLAKSRIKRKLRDEFGELLDL